ncbi:hypothetical protein LX32DRAFT_80521 [Colletotrichum zoysiae]|uniref:Uncharacterized protein n=1 Tax=Colletotrichum zoysiae TaxID=1216348 RepID=A0AAD9HAQ5_9PEZI|nr:hypothetical protein LX32DRAFT_80521 [Colletotrichum zoysiae]
MMAVSRHIRLIYQSSSIILVNLGWGEDAAWSFLLFLFKWPFIIARPCRVTVRIQQDLKTPKSIVGSSGETKIAVCIHDRTPSVWEIGMLQCWVVDSRVPPPRPKIVDALTPEAAMVSARISARRNEPRDPRGGPLTHSGWFQRHISLNRRRFSAVFTFRPLQLPLTPSITFHRVRSGSPNAGIAAFVLQTQGMCAYVPMASIGRLTFSDKGRTAVTNDVDAASIRTGSRAPEDSESAMQEPRGLSKILRGRLRYIAATVD